MYSLSKREEELLLTIWNLREDAYLVAIREKVNKLAEKDLTVGAIHIPLNKLEKEGLIDSAFGESTPVRGGRRKRIYRITETGLEFLKNYKKRQDALWSEFNEAFSL